MERPVKDICGHVSRFPFNWDPQRVGTMILISAVQNVIKMFPFNWDPQRVGTFPAVNQELGDMLFPFNWDPQRVGTLAPRCRGITWPMVSIQLGSPASGDPWKWYSLDVCKRFPFNWDPQRVGTQFQYRFIEVMKWFPFNWDPQRVGTRVSCCTCCRKPGFPFNWDPQRVGTSKKEAATVS